MGILVTFMYHISTCNYSAVSILCLIISEAYDTYHHQQTSCYLKTQKGEKTKHTEPTIQRHTIETKLKDQCYKKPPHFTIISPTACTALTPHGSGVYERYR